MGFLKLFLIVTTLAKSAYGVSWQATPFNPASVPLAVRTPYLSAWLRQGQGNALNDAWPQFWAGATLGWCGYINVDGTTYSFLGIPNNNGTSKATQKSLTFMSTQSISVMTAGPIDLTARFLSPVEPTNLLLQSLPLSYMAISAAANDGGSHAVKIYTDISAEWLSGDRSMTANCTTTIGDIITHQSQLESPSVYTESNDQIEQGSVHYSTSSPDSATHQTGADTDVRGQFISTGSLSNTQDTNFRAIDDSYPVFGLAKDLGTVAGATDPIVFSIGLIRDPAVQYIVAGGALQDRSSYFWSTYSSAAAAISDFLGAYSTALTAANTLDAQVQSDAAKISDDYAAIVAFDGSWNTSDVLVFLKEISSDGNVNTVDVIFPSWPVLLYSNSFLGEYLLEGLFAYQATGQYPNKWSVHDLGASYPKAIGHNDGSDEAMPVEECGNMLIMALSYAQKSGDNSQLKQYSGLLAQWTDYLIEDSLIPADQLSTDDFAGTLANQTNLAIKGIVGIAAKAKISTLLGDTASASNYSSIATSYVPQFQGYATASDSSHLTLSYGDSASWGLSYNMYGDTLLGLDVFPSSIYDMQTAWYATVANSYGVPLDTRHTYTKSDWQLWTAAIVTNTTVRDMFISGVYNYAQDGQSSQPLGDWYDTAGGAVEGFRARPVVRGHLALMIL